MLDTYFSVLPRDSQPTGNRLVERPLGHQLEHLSLARRERLQRAVVAGCGQEPGDDLRIKRRTAVCDASQGGDELPGVGDPILQEVPERSGLSTSRCVATPTSTWWKRIRMPTRGSRAYLPFSHIRVPST
jgi:hypothetical protein